MMWRNRQNQIFLPLHRCLRGQDSHGHRRLRYPQIPTSRSPIRCRLYQSRRHLSPSSLAVPLRVGAQHHSRPEFSLLGIQICRRQGRRNRYEGRTRKSVRRTEHSYLCSSIVEVIFLKPCWNIRFDTVFYIFLSYNHYGGIFSAFPLEKQRLNGIFANNFEGPV